MNLFIAEDDRAVCYAYEMFLKNMGHGVKSVHDGRQALDLLEKERFDLVILDVKLPEMSGIEIVKRFKDDGFEITFVLISGEEEIIDSINAIELGVHDFLTKPIDYEDLRRIIIDVESSLSRKTRKVKYRYDASTRVLKLDDFSFIGDQAFSHSDIGHIGFFSPPMQGIFKKVKKLHAYPQIPVLIEGETGTGKEVVARLLHFDSPRSNDPFIALNCSNFKKELFEAELFGYEKGAFTGSDPKGREGKFCAAGQGSLFLDEISEIPIEMQPKLLRVLQEKEYYKVGGNKKEFVNCRIICATNRNLEQMIADGDFREDLFYRLSLCKIEVPPLRKRKEEIPALFMLFVRQINIELGKSIEAIEKDVIDLIEAYDWPGNIREMKNLLHKVLLFTEEPLIRKKHIEAFLHDAALPLARGNVINAKDFTLPAVGFDLEEYALEIVRRTLQRFDGNKTKTAEFLDLSLSQLYQRYKV